MISFFLSKHLYTDPAAPHQCLCNIFTRKVQGMTELSKNSNKIPIFSLTGMPAHLLLCSMYANHLSQPPAKKTTTKMKIEHFLWAQSSQ